ncbi:MAG: hypothetical protein M3325_18890, partial [Actinomycetota bacterium]|nr:hypothetical protein [Actinomycetota bacterium]
MGWDEKMVASPELTSRPWWKRAWAWGLIAAIVLAILTPLFDADIKLQVSIVVVLIGWVLTAAIEQYLSLDATQQRLSTQMEQAAERLDEVRQHFAALVAAMG